MGPRVRARWLPRCSRALVAAVQHPAVRLVAPRCAALVLHSGAQGAAVGRGGLVGVVRVAQHAVWGVVGGREGRGVRGKEGKRVGGRGFGTQLKGMGCGESAAGQAPALAVALRQRLPWPAHSLLNVAIRLMVSPNRVLRWIVASHAVASLTLLTEAAGRRRQRDEHGQTGPPAMPQAGKHDASTRRRCWRRLLAASGSLMHTH